MIPVEQALEIILSNIEPMGSEKVPLLDGLGRVIAEDIVAERPIPPWDNSAMDGYAVRAEDVRGASPERPVRLRVLEDLPAGRMPSQRVGPGEAIRIMTGAPIPEGADAVVKVEDTRLEGGGGVAVLAPVPKGEDIRSAGEDVRDGEFIIPRGTVMRPAEVGMLASLSRSFIQVFQRPQVAILSTGDELVDIDGKVAPGKIVNSNSYSIASQVRECGGTPLQLGIARDSQQDVERLLRVGLDSHVLLTTGGVSVGDYDFVKDALNSLGAEIKLWKVAMKPGKPLAFGVVRGRPVFGLPGNPVSSMVSFEQFVRPSLLKMQGHKKLFRPVINATLLHDIHKTPGRRHFVRSVVSLREGNYEVAPLGAQGSNILHSMVRANGLLIFPETLSELKAGSSVKVQLLDRRFELQEKADYGVTGEEC